MENLDLGAQGLYSLSLSQQNIWDIECACPGTPINNICTTLHIRGRVDFSALQRSVELVLAADSSLRTRVTLRDKVPMQYQSPLRPEAIPIYDFTLSTRDGIAAWEQSFAREVMPTLDAPLYHFVLLRTGETTGSLVMKLHHLISDGWTQIMLCNRICAVYLDLLEGKESRLDPSPSYQTHIEAETRYFSSSAYKRDEAYWQQMLEHPGEPAALKSLRSAAVSNVGRRLTFALPQDLNSSIYSFCKQNRLAPFSVFYMALAIYLKRTGGADRFTIGVPIFNRSSYIDKQTSGMFVSTLPFFGELDSDWSLTRFTEEMSTAWLNLLRHQRFPFRHIQALSSGKAAGNRLFHIALSYQNGQLLESRNPAVSFSARWHYSGYQLEQLCIHLNNIENDRRYCVDYDYLTQFFSAGEVESLHSCLVSILREALAEPERPIRQLSLLEPRERERVLYTNNCTEQPLPQLGLYERFRSCVQHKPEQVVLIENGVRTTYRTLEELSCRVHAALTELCAKPDTLVAVLLPRSAALFSAMMGVLRAGGAFLLLSPSLPEGRIREILTQSGASALLTMPEYGRSLSDLLPAIDMSCLPEPTQQPPASVPETALAYVVYTSGSTGAPKGVEIERRSLLNLACAMAPIYGKSAVLSMCNVSFDAFLLESACAMLNGRTILLPGEDELESPKALAGLITGFRAGFISTTPSRLAALLKDESFRAAMANIDSVICGGEAFPNDLLQRLHMVTQANIYNQYGPAEATVAVSLKRLSDTITAGQPMNNCKLYVLDNWGNPLPTGVYGNLYVGGLCVGRGYRNAPELTAERFSVSPFEPDERLYNTGDIACWTPEGEIRLAGRSDHQVKLRGLRVEPEETASCLARHPMVRQSYAAVQRHSGQDVLVAFYTADAPIPEEELLALCAAYLPHYMIPSAILPLDEIPLTENGKVAEYLLPYPDLTAAVAARPETPTQATLLTILRRVLGRADLGVDGDYFLFGGNSLNAMESISSITDTLGYTLRVADLYTCRSVRRLAALIDREAGRTPAPAQHLAPAPALERWPLTPIQQGIYVQSHMDPTGMTYHMPGAFRLGAAPDHDKLEQAFRALIAQEPLLRTAFVSEDDGIFARVRDQVPFTLPVFHGGSLEEASRAVLAPFDLAQPPLLRAALWEEAPGRWVLLMNTHHMIGDGLTSPLLLKKLDALYQGQPSAPAPLTYLDYAWHLSRQNRQDGRMDYWKTRLSPLPEPLELPGDFARTKTFDFRGGNRSHRLSPALSAACDAFCAEKGISPYMFFLSAFGVLLSRLSGKEDMVVGAAAAGRLLPETQSMCGPFINTLPLRLMPARSLAPDTYLDAVRDEVNGMLDHQQVGLEDIVSALGIQRTLSQSPLFQVIFSQRPIDAGQFTLGGMPMEHMPLPTGTARMDLWVELAREGDCYTFHLEYATQLFLADTAAYFGRCLESVAASMLTPGIPSLGELNALSPQDRETLIDIPNHTADPFLNRPIPQQFASHLEQDPEAPAVIFHGQTTSRRALDQRACQIANLLTRAGAKSGCKVGIALNRSADLVAAVLGIWKMGGAYAPLLAHYPEQRLQYMIEVADITHILCDQSTRAKLPDTLPVTLVSVEESAPDTFQAVPLAETDLAEVLFTSGSTGQPKGVMLVWRSIANMAEGFRQILSRSDGPILCTTNVVFDMFNGEVVIPLSMGKTIVMADEEEMMLPWKLAELIRRDGVKITQSTPSRVQMWFSNETFCQAAPLLDLMIYGGEVLTETLLQAAQTAACNATQVNMYGPTEGTVYNTTRVADYRSHINVGWPMLNNRVYILDEQLCPVLPTAVGDLYLAGECVSAGYISRPDLTEAAFLPDPFFPGEQMYRTGDIARLRLDGSYDFLGRRDAQVKLNGQRVELDEINGALVSQGCALQAATVPVRREDGSMELFTYYIPVPDGPDTHTMRERLGKVLPAYMIPSYLLPLESMPSTPTGKINLRELKERAQSGQALEAAKSAASSSAPAQKAAPPQPEPTAVPGSLDWILSIWRKVLSRTQIDPDQSFFEQGGTSLAALSVLSHYQNGRFTLSLAQFYQYPSAAGQARLLAPQMERFRADPTHAKLPTARTLVVSPSQSRQEFPARVPLLPTREELPMPHTVLLTGATGFLGAHILNTLVESGVSTVICTMRDGSRERLVDTLTWYFGTEQAQALSDRVQILSANLSQPMLGLSEEDQQALTGCIGAIWNCAADVRHYAADSDVLLRTNLNGTQELIKLAKAANVPLYHMSTTSVGGQHLVGRSDRAVFTERDFHIGQDWRSNLYARSKFLAENAVFTAMDEGLNARVFRLGRLVGRASDGKFQINPKTNSFWLVLRGIHALGAIPASMASVPVELTPIDWCAQAAVALREAPQAVFHLQSPVPPTMEAVCRAVAPHLQVLPDEAFARRLAQAPVDSRGDLLAPFQDLLAQQQSEPVTIEVDNCITMDHLRQVGFTLPIPGPERLLHGFEFDPTERMTQGSVHP